MAATLATQPPQEVKITVGGFLARELEYQGNLGFYTARIVVADTRLYIVLAAGTEGFGNPDVRRFIESFTITAQALVAEGKKREEKAKLATEREEKQAREREQKKSKDDEEKNKDEEEKK